MRDVYVYVARLHSVPNETYEMSSKRDMILLTPQCDFRSISWVEHCVEYRFSVHSRDIITRASLRVRLDVEDVGILARERG